MSQPIEDAESKDDAEDEASLFVPGFWLFGILADISLAHRNTTTPENVNSENGGADAQRL